MFDLFDPLINFVFTWLLSVWDTITLSAPWLLAGVAVAGLVHVLLPATAITRHLQAPGLKSVLKASAFGIPLPLCSCSVIPVGLSLRRSGASKGATASFFISTPEIGLDSFSLSWGLLGAPLAFVRAFAAFISAVVAGVLIDVFDNQTTTETAEDVSKPCCSSNSDTEAEVSSGVFAVLQRALKFAVFELMVDISIALTAGLFLAGLIAAILPENFFLQYQLGDFTMMLVMIGISMPLYVCATSSTPLAAALFAKGLAPGAVLVLLLVGPATNISTLFVLSKELGLRATIIYAGSIALVALGLGFLANEIPSIFLSPLPSLGQGGLASPVHNHGNGILDFVLAVLLSALLFFGIWRRLRGSRQK